MNRWLVAVLCLLTGVPAPASPQSALAAAWEDAKGIPAEVAPYTRYLDLSNLPADYLDEARGQLAFHTNQLSRNPDLIPLRRVNPTLVSVNLKDYGWTTSVWEKFASTDPYFHVQLVREYWWPGGIWPNDGKYYAANSFKAKRLTPAAAPWLNRQQMAGLMYHTQSQAPLLRADWWFANTCRQLSYNGKQTGHGYYDFLQVKNRTDFHKLIKLNERDSIEFGRDMRAAMEASVLSEHGRQIGRLQSLGGGYWFTLDADSSQAEKNPVRNIGRGDYKHQAEELYGVLGNRLFAYFLGDNNGKRQDSAPDFISGDDSPLNRTRDKRIHVCLACIRCHVDGLRDVDDHIRKTVRNPVQLNADTYEKFLELRRQYFSNLKKQLEDDRQVFADTVKEVNGLSVLENSKAFSRLYENYVLRSRGPKEIASEMGITDERLLTSIKGYAKVNRGKLDLVLSGLVADPPTPMRAPALEELMPLLWEIVGVQP